ncbi:MAG TPA: hypothetical protein VGQ99_20385 [Tepidisphaeraceae bacterium]|jgi:hypothetical protein|nr:hypothetical protein [Tepidisphaeraceae bacterium]
MSENQDLHPLLDRIQRPALIAGGVGVLLCIIGLLINAHHREQFFRSYLLAYLFWLGIPLGSFAVLMLQHLTGGRWGLVLRRLLETAARTLPLMAVLFIPLFFGLGKLYIWVSDPAARGEGTSGLRTHYLTSPFFILRTIFYFALWIGLAFILNHWSNREDRAADPNLVRRFRLLSSGGLLIYCLTMTFAAIDWVMSLDPHWYSTIFGLLFIVGQALGSLALMTALLALVSTRPPLSSIVTADHFHDLGNLLLAFTMLWAYMQFSQFLIIWSGNIAEETPFYIYRTQRGWQVVGLLLIVFHFFIPFILLLNRRTKRTPRILAYVGLAIVAMRLVDLFWTIVPHHAQGHRRDVPYAIMHWLDIAAVIGIGGIWIWWFIFQLRRTALVPVNDPRLLGVATHA